jgi:hypothetical protein
MKRRNSRLIFLEQSRTGNEDSGTLASAPPDDHLLADMDKVVAVESIHEDETEGSTKKLWNVGEIERPRPL